LGGSAGRSLEILTDSTEYFRELVESANKNQGGPVGHELESYVVILLKEYLNASNLFGDSDSEEGRSNPALFEKLASALEAENPEHRVMKLRKMGDFALYISGFFSESLSNKIVNPSYYIQMGETAYLHAGKFSKPNHKRELFSHLSKKFIPLVNILTEVSDAAGIRASQSLLNLYENWLITGSENAKKEILDEGVIPINLNDLKEQ
jgi:hypothetical protein